MARAVFPSRAWVRAFLVAGVGLFQVTGSSTEAGTHLQARSMPGSVYEATRPFGEKQLDNLAKTSATEDAWLFAMGRWIDIGLDEKAKGVLLDEGTALEALEAAGRTSATGTTFYHIHPFDTDATFVDPPSVQDIQALAFLKGDHAEVVGVLFDGRGKWTFDLPPKLAEGILEVRERSSNDDDSAWYAFKHGYTPIPPSPYALFDMDYTVAVWAASAVARSTSRAQGIRAFIEGARELGVVVAYSEFADVVSGP